MWIKGENQPFLHKRTFNIIWGQLSDYWKWTIKWKFFLHPNFLYKSLQIFLNWNSRKKKKTNGWDLFVHYAYGNTAGFFPNNFIRQNGNLLENLKSLNFNLSRNVFVIKINQQMLKIKIRFNINFIFKWTIDIWTEIEKWKLENC